jgi:hypothetical protein
MVSAQVAAKPQGGPPGVSRELSIPRQPSSRGMLSGKQRVAVDRSAGWGVAVMIMVVGAYMYTTKPSCRDGFTPLIGWGVGWYCAPGYKPLSLSQTQSD